jgi:hypothetical protein
MSAARLCQGQSVDWSGRPDGESAPMTTGGRFLGLCRQTDDDDRLMPRANPACGSTNEGLKECLNLITGNQTAIIPSSPRDQYNRISKETTMAISTTDKAGIVASYQRAQGDTGSPEVQVALPDRPHQRPYRSLQGPHQGSSLPSRPAQDGQPASQDAGLPEAQECRQLSFADRASWSAQVIRPDKRRYGLSESRDALCALIQRGLAEQAGTAVMAVPAFVFCRKELSC